MNGSLHLLIDPDEKYWYNSVRFALADDNGIREELDAATVYLGETQEHGSGTVTSDRQEQLLELPEGVDYSALRLGYTASTYEDCIEGSWETTFLLQEMTDIISAAVDMDMKPWHLTEIMLSPVGVEMQGRGEMREDSITPEVSIQLTDGTRYDLDSAVTTNMATVYAGEEGAEDLIKCNLMLTEPLDVNTVASISINGAVVWSRTVTDATT